MDIERTLRRTCSVGFVAMMIACNPSVWAQNLTSKGTDFYAAFTQNYSPTVESLDLFISGAEAASGTIEFLETGTSQPFTIVPNQVLRIQAPPSSQLTTNMVIEKKSIHVSADKEISLYGLNNVTYSTDGFLSLPTAALGNSYRVASYIPIQGYQSTTAIIATQDGTTVTVTPTVAVLANPANTPINFTLNRGETYQILSANDLTGTSVTSNYPIAVLSGATCANIPVGYSACDMLTEQMIPTTSWGTSYFMAPLASRSGGARYRIIADQADTTITVNGTVVATIGAGAFHELNSTEALSIQTSKPTSVIQYANSKDFDPSSSTGDPFMMLVPPSGLYINDYTLATADADPASPRFSKNYIGIVSPIDPATQQPVDVSLNEVLIPKTDFTLSPQSDFFYVNINVTPGSYHISSPVGVGVNIYGFTDYDSYGYVGGLGLAKISNINEIKLSPAEDATRWVNEQYCVTALVTDAGDAPLDSVKVDVKLTGANPQISSIFTDASGKAPFCYSGSMPGTDTLVLSAGGKSATSLVKWLQSASEATLALTPATASNPINIQQCFDATLVDATSQPLANMSISFDVSGVNPQQSSVTTDAAGKAQLCYVGISAGNDTLSATSGPLKQTSSVTWTVTPLSQSLNLSPAALTSPVNTTQCFVATLTDTDNHPVPNQAVMLEVSGVNTQSTSFMTDSAGSAKLCYTSAEAGVDTITATADNEIKSGRAKALQVRTATVTWQAVGAAHAIPVPVFHPAALILLTSLLGGFAWLQRRRGIR
ncbi:IPTL-CTERM sorting domain-containing protein [Comamonas sp.]|uniref:IPTL-CTERM sorting domain-containing protein n=1 Tax=Comamonas sp. TaxID=34028 RepID=UPI00289DBD28|nr:IPTL-CTERM sorting domain-containing protein [Comamonas sp.]